jgi:F0F1-type ATP synthase delta subunit
MIEKNTVARIYAKAVFEHALESKALDFWSILLDNLAQIISNESGIYKAAISGVCFGFSW